MLRVITPPATWPVSIVEAKDFIGVTVSTHDSLVGFLIAAATARAEQLTGRALVEQTLELTLDEFPDRITLPNPPLRAVASIKYMDTDGVEQTMASGTYSIIDSSDVRKPFITPVYGSTWPATRDIPGAVRVRYTAGWPLTTASPPAPTTPDAIRTWIMARVAGLYGQRESFVVGQQVFEMPRDFLDGLLDPYRIIEVA